MSESKTSENIHQIMKPNNNLFQGLLYDKSTHRLSTKCGPHSKNISKKRKVARALTVDRVPFQRYNLQCLLDVQVID